MKKLLAFVFVFLCTSTLLAQLASSKTVKQYKEDISKLEGHVKGVDTLDFYKEYVFKNKNDNKEFKFKDLTDLQQRIYIILEIEALSGKIDYIREFIKRQVKLAPEGKAKTEDDPAGKDDINNILLEIKLQKTLTLFKYERALDELFKKYKDKFTEQEIAEYKNKVKKEREKL